MARKPKFDSIEATVSTLAKIGKTTTSVVIPDFVKITPEARKFWPIVVRARGATEWSDADLTLAADVCACMADMEEQAAILKQEGYVIANFKGMPIQNPRNSVMETLTRRKVAIFRILQINARSLNGEVSKVSKERGNTQDLQDLVSKIQDDDLLASPVH